MIMTTLSIIALFVFIWVVAPIAADCKYETITCRCGLKRCMNVLILDDNDTLAVQDTLINACPRCQITGGHYEL